MDEDIANPENKQSATSVIIRMNCKYLKIVAMQ